MEIRQHLNVYGRVQGVGFRYRAKRMADALELPGTVRNLEDGSVELEVQGDDRLIEEYIDRLCHSSYIFVSRIERCDREPVSEQDFRILDYY